MISAKPPMRAEVTPPTRAGMGPHVRRSAGAVAVAAILVACANTDANTVQPPVVLGMSSSVAAYYTDQQVTLYEVHTPVPLQVRKPTDAEVAALGKADPYPRAPFLLASDLRIEVRFTLSNLDDAQHSVELLLDPWNEFVRWEPGVTVVSDEMTVPNYSGYDKFFVLPGKSRVSGTITNDDTNELAVDLATAMNVVKNPPAQGASVDTTTMLNHVFDLQNRSNDGDPLVTPYIPKVIAGLTGFDLGLRAYGGDMGGDPNGKAPNIAVEIVVDVTDENGNRLLPSGSTDKPMGRPETALSPPGARQGN